MKDTDDRNEYQKHMAQSFSSEWINRILLTSQFFFVILNGWAIAGEIGFFFWFWKQKLSYCNFNIAGAGGKHLLFVL